MGGWREGFNGKADLAAVVPQEKTDAGLGLFIDRPAFAVDEETMRKLCNHGVRSKADTMPGVNAMVVACTD